MTAPLLLIRPSLLMGANLFRPLSPFTPDPPAVWFGSQASTDHRRRETGRRSPGDSARLSERLICVRATVSHHVPPVGLMWYWHSAVCGLLARPFLGQAALNAGLTGLQVRHGRRCRPDSADPALAVWPAHWCHWSPRRGPGPHFCSPRFPRKTTAET
jgi:hypothetical protein